MSTGPGSGNCNDGPISGLLAYFDQHGLFAQWYWRPGVHGNAWNLLHGNGWRIA